MKKVFFTLLFLHFFEFLSAQSPKLLKDINTRTGNSFFHNISNYKDSLLIFRVNNTNDSLDICISDTSASSLKCFYKLLSHRGAYFNISPEFNNKIYFSQSNSGSYGVWVTDGTNTGTKKITSDFAGLYNNFVVLNDRLLNWGGGIQYLQNDTLKYYYKNNITDIRDLDTLSNSIFFIGKYNNVQGLYKLNAIDSTIIRIDENVSWSAPSKLLKVYKNKVYYYKNGTTLTIYDINLNQIVSSQNIPELYIEKMFTTDTKFLIQTGNFSGYRFYEVKSDNTVSLISNLNNADKLIKLKKNKYIYYKINYDKTADLWKSDSTFTNPSFVEQINLYKNTYQNLPSSILIDSVYYFTHIGDYIYQTDGTSNGTMLIDSTSSSDWALSYPFKSFKVIKNKIFCLGLDFKKGYEILNFKKNTLGHTVFKDFNNNTLSSTPFDFHNLNDGKLYFWSSDSSSKVKAWITDGTESGTKVLIEDYFTKGISTGQIAFMKFKNKYFFEMDDKFYAYDIDLKKTILISPFINSDLISLGDYIYFFKTNSYYNIWRTDGTLEGTTELLNSQNAIFKRIIFNNKLYYINAYTPTQANSELWAFDPQTNSYEKIKTFNHFNSTNLQFTNLNDKIFITLLNSDKKLEIWLSDGTESGTTHVKTIGTSLGNNISKLFVGGNKVYFNFEDNIPNEMRVFQQWVSDGTSNGTYVLKDKITSGEYCYCNQQIFFDAAQREPPYKNVLYKSDGTPQGTTKILDNYFNNYYSFTNFRCQDNAFFFMTIDNFNGEGIYKTDGTDAGTIKIHSINSPNNYKGFEILNKNKLILNYNTTQLGEELYEININCPQNLQIPKSVLENEAFNASNNIESIQNMNINSVYSYQAGKAIELKPGFSVVKGGYFIGEIKTCN